MNSSSGFSEEAGAEFVVGPSVVNRRAVESVTAKIKVGPAGRIVIPADVREALGVQDGDTLLCVVENRKMTVTSVRSALAEAQALVRRYVPADVSLSDELIADRRREVEEELRRG